VSVAAREVVAAPARPLPMLEASGLSRHFRIGAELRRRRVLRAVDDVSLALRPGTITALVGESGSGKSTVARLLALLDRPTAGSIRFGADDIGRLRRRRDVLRYRSQVQLIFQDPFDSLNPVKRVEHHIERPLRIHNVVPDREVRSRVRELLESVGLVPPDEIALKYPHQLSGGQRQRVSIARALAVEPAVLLADEPISMLDVSIRLDILNLMLELKRERGIAFLYVTHDIASARYVADEVLVMYAGQIVEQGPTDEVLQHPLHPYTRLLLSAVPNPEAGLRQQRLPPRSARRLPPEHAGCRFADRCLLAVDSCLAAVPELLELRPGHLVRCPITTSPTT
jgi:peptide/nickel transport system ATP-binding protein